MLILLAAAVTQPPALQPAFEPMAFLIGHCWKGEFESGETDTHCFDAIYGGQHVRDVHEVKGGKSVYRGETIYSRDGQAVSYTYWNSLGGVSRGSMRAAGDRLDFGTEHHRTKDGKHIAIVTHWRRQGQDAYEAVTSSTQMPSMNRTVVYRRFPEAIDVSSRKSSDGSYRLSHETVIDAPASEVWTAIATADGWKGWAVPAAWMDGDVLETSYNAGASPGDDSTIRQQLLASVPERVMAFRTVKAPRGFPNFDSFQRVAHVFELDSVGPNRTRVRLTGAGYADDEAGRQLIAFFTEGNRISLERLQRRFDSGPIDWTKEKRTEKVAGAK